MRKCLKSQCFSIFKDVYGNRPLPHLIGTSDFFRDELVGLGESSGEGTTINWYRLFVLFFLHAVKCSLSELITRSVSLILLAIRIARCACTRIPCALGVVCIVACSDALTLAFWHFGVFGQLWISEHLSSPGTCISQSWRLRLWWFPTPFPPSFHCLAHCGGCLLSSLSRGGSWSPALQGFASHGSSLLLGAARLPIVKAPGCLRHQTSTSQVIIFLKLATIIYHCQKLILFLFASSSLCCQFISVNFHFCLFQFNRRWGRGRGRRIQWKWKWKWIISIFQKQWIREWGKLKLVE